MSIAIYPSATPCYAPPPWRKKPTGEKGGAWIFRDIPRELMKRSKIAAAVSMPFPIMDNEIETLKQLNRSGFPFQLRVEHEIRTTQSLHGWSIASREHPWKNLDSETSGFIDLVLHHETFPGDRMVVECKRVKSDDSRQLQWLFLLPDPDPKDTTQTSCLEVAGPFPDKHGEWRDIRIWENLQVLPASFQSEFCILSGDEPRRQPILASLCADALESIDGLVEEEVNVCKSQEKGKVRLFLFPVIVTNANLKVCQFKLSDVRINDGTFDPETIKLIDVPFIRFRKSLVTKFPEGIFRSLGEAHRAGKGASLSSIQNASLIS